MEGELLRRYALALALVPDEDAAGDLFMDARTESDLRRRAASWRRQQGLPPAEEPEELPALTEPQREHGLYLARRARLRRRARLWLISGAAVLAAIPLAMAILRPAPNPSDQAPPPEQTAQVNGLRFTVHRAAATPGRVTIHWTLEGAGAAGASMQEPWLLLEGAENWVAPRSTDSHREAETSTRLRGQTIYRTPVPAGASALVHVGRVNGGAVDWTVRVPVEAMEDPAARTVLVGETFFIRGRTRLDVESVTLSPDYTLIRHTWQVESESGAGFTTPQLIAITAPEGRPYMQRWRTSLRQEYGGALFDPVPASTRRLKLHFTRLTRPLGPQMVSLIPPSSVGLVREGVNLRAVVPLDANVVLGRETPYFEDEAGLRYPIAVEIDGDFGQQRQATLSAEVPLEVRPVRLVIPERIFLGETPVIEIDLGGAEP